MALVFVATNERALLVRALESLDASPPSRSLEIVVVDNASADGTAEELRRRWPHVAVLRRDRRRWLNDNLNFGVKATHSPYVMICNSDICFRPGAVDSLARFLDRHPAAGVAGPKLVSPSGERSPSARRWYSVAALVVLRWPWVKDPARFACVHASRYAEWDHASPRAVEWVPCPATMLRRVALDQLGPMDERFEIYWVDMDLCMQMHEQGWQVWCVPHAEVVHDGQRASTRVLSRAWFSHLDSLVKLVWKYKGLRPARRCTLAPRQP